MKPFVLSAQYSVGSGGMSSHYHDCHQIIYITEGSAEITVAGKHYFATAGSIVLISRLEQHSITVKSHPYHRWTLTISPEQPPHSDCLEELVSVLVNRPSNFSHLISVGDNRELFSTLFKQILREKKTGGVYSDEMADLGLRSLLINLYRICPELFTASSGGSDIIRGIQSRFERDCASRYTLSSLAKEYGISVYYLCHLFKTVTGYSVMEHLSSCRIAAAKKYLAETKLSIGEIVELCGFSNSSNFSRKFRETTGISPSRFRKKYR